MFSTILLQGIDCFVPVASCNSRAGVHHSGVVRKIISKRRSLRRIKRSWRSDLSIVKYNAATTVLNNALVNEAASKELKIIKSGNLGQFYKHVNSRLNHRTGIAPLTKPDGSFCISASEKLKMFSNYFASVGIIDDGYLPNLKDHCVLTGTNIINVSSSDTICPIASSNDPNSFTSKLSFY